MGERTHVSHNGERPIIPREHGAWMMIYIPALVGVSSPGQIDLLPALIFFVALTATFFIQNVVGDIIRGHPEHGAYTWLIVYGALLGTAGVGLILVDRLLLAPFLVPAALLFGFQMIYVWPRHKRLSRARSVGLATTAILTSSGAAAAVAADPTDLTTALAVWGLCALFFCGSVAFVKVRVGSMGKRQSGSGVVWPNVLSAALHVLQSAICISAWLAASTGAALCLTAAFTPSIGRAVLRRRKPIDLTVKGLGWREAALAVWFAAWVVAGIRVGLDPLYPP